LLICISPAAWLYRIYEFGKPSASTDPGLNTFRQRLADLACRGQNLVIEHRYGNLMQVPSWQTRNGGLQVGNHSWTRSEGSKPGNCPLSVMIQDVVNLKTAKQIGVTIRECAGESGSGDSVKTGNSQWATGNRRRKAHE
jgi:hypothetical protein